jgi:YidC/Oxa1 family membrane protein insertase
MDRNQAIGLTLIGALLVAYFYWFAPEPQPATPETAAPKTAVVQDTTSATTQVDSTVTQQYGDLAQAFNGQETITRLETEDVKVAFSNRGFIREMELKHFKTYSQEPLKLITPATDKFSLYTKYQGKPFDLYALYYKLEQSKKGDTTVVTYTAPAGNGAITHTYSIPAKGYEIGYSVSVKGLEQQLNNEPLAFQWNDILKPVEKDLADTRIYSTVTYYSDEDGFDELPERSTSAEKETLAEPLKWVAIKEKFFLQAIIAKNHFASGEVETNLDPNDTSVVKLANVRLNIPYADASSGKALYKFYLGPNDYNLVGNVTEGFARNVYLGWKPIYWINKFVIFPVFNLLTKFISNYGIIIIILVILLKLVLAPLSYRSYLSMAKMKVLKPELDEIKERVGDDMAKVQQEQLKLYQQVGVNPISGCVPVLLQMPLIFAMFYLFPASIELRQQPFLWAEDLSTYDSIINFSFSLPFLGSHISLFTLLMTASTLIYTWQNNQISSVTGPMKSMSYIMPLIFFFVLNSFSAGLTFYYLVSNLGTFAQQAIIRRFVDDDKIRAIMEENRKKNAEGKGTKSKFMNKLQDAMKASEEARRKGDDQRRKPKK